MFNFRRSMSTPRRSTTSPPTSEIPSTPTQDPPPLPPGLSPSSHSYSYSGSQLRTSSSHKNSPFNHHLQQSRSKILGRKTGTNKYPPPIEHKAQSPKRPATSTGLIDRVSSFFTSSSSGSGKPTVRGGVAENATTAAETGRDDRSTAPPSKPKSKSLVNKLTRSSSKKSEDASTTPTKIKRVPPPLAVTSTSSASPSSSEHTSSPFQPFRSIARSRSKLAQQLLGSFHEPEVDNTDERAPSSLSSLHPSCSLRSVPYPRSPRSPRTPRSPFFYTVDSDAESDIRRPSGLGRRVSTTSLPPSPFGGSYPWEALPSDQGAQKLSEAGSEYNKNKDEKARSEVQEQSSDEKGKLKEGFRFPRYNSVVDLTSEVSGVDSPTNATKNGTDENQRKGGRPRAVSSPGLLLSIGRKVREKLERERELGKLKHQPPNIQKANEVTERKSSYSYETKLVRDTKNIQDTHNTQGKQSAQGPQDAPNTQNVQELQETTDTNVEVAHASQPGIDVHAHELYRASVYSIDSETAGSRERMMSFSLVHEFPEPPSTCSFTYPSRTSSESGCGTLMTLPPPSSALAFPLQPPSLEVVTVKRSSSSTMDSSASATTTTTTATSVGIDGTGSICNAVRKRMESCSPREIVVPAIAQTSNNVLPTPCLFHPQPVSDHLPTQILRSVLSFLPEKKHIAPLASINKTYADVVRSLLYDTLDLDAFLCDEGDKNTTTIRVQKLLATLVKGKHLTVLTTKFVCREWPKWFPLSRNDDGEEEAQEIELQNTFLASTLVLVLSRMTRLKELVLPSYHPFLFSDLTLETRWTGLKTVEFTNTTLGDEEARDMFAWLNNLSGLEKLSFPWLVEKIEIATKSWNESVSSIKSPSSPNRSSLCLKRTSVPLTPQTAISGKQSSIGTETLYSPVSLNSVELGSEETSRQQLPSVLSLEKYAHSWTFLPNLRALHAPPMIVSLLAVSRDEENSQQERRPWRPLSEVTINIDMTLYAGLRPTALFQSLLGIKRLGLKFGERVDRRTVEKVFIAAGAALGSNGLEKLNIEFVGAWATMADERLYKIIDIVLPRYPDLRQLKLGYTKNEITTSTDMTVFELSPTEETRLSQWMKQCPNLACVGLLSGSSWRRMTV